jgi:LmbE family N-acetylglucosaminyl deacetylase
LCLGCHADDIEIGCGGAILQLAEQYSECSFHWVVFSATGVREAEARRAAGLFAGPERLKGPFLKSFRDGFLPYVGAEVKTAFEELKREVSPDLIFTHNGRDAHQDHRLVSELTWNTFRDHMILEYEIPKYDGDLGRTNFFVPLEEDVCRRKMDYLFEAFPSQQGKHWFKKEMFLGLMRVRGMECNSPSGYAEGFYCRKAAF